MEREINQLISDCYQFLVESNYTSNTLFHYKSLWRRGIHPYMEVKKETLYTMKLGDEFISECYPDTSHSPTASEMSRSIRFLNDYLQFGYVRRKSFIPVHYPLYGEIGFQMQKLITHLQENRRSSITVEAYRRYMNRFLSYLTKEKITSVEEINEHHILQFISTQENQKVVVIGHLRVLFHFWYDQHISTVNYEEILKAYRWRRKERKNPFILQSKRSSVH